MSANPFHEAPLETLATALHRAAGAVETHDTNLANPKHAERLRLLLIAAGNRLAPGHESIHTSAEQQVAGSVTYASAYGEAHRRDAAWNRLRWLQRAANHALGMKADRWMRSPPGQVTDQPASWALDSDDGLHRALEALDQAVASTRSKRPSGSGRYPQSSNARATARSP